MSEIINDKQVFTLLEVTKSIQKTLNDRYKSAYWIKAEMNKLNFYSHSGHCYPELLEKVEGRITAQIKSFIWKKDYDRINQNFLSVLKEPLKDGIKILFQAKITFDPVHGISLWILDIDPNFTLGDLEKEKQDTIKQLKKEGIYFRNKELDFPLLPQRVAIISVETSKGYADFIKVLSTNVWGYKYFDMLFPSLLQGDKAVQNIINQLQNIKKVIHHFDVVAIIRGGGGDVGLSCFNNYHLSKEIALFPIPVLTGIGHATNETVVEMVSYSNAITPTKLAEFMLQKFHNFSVPVQNASEKIIAFSKKLISNEKLKIQSETKLFRSVSENILSSQKNNIRNIGLILKQHITFVFKFKKEELTTIKSNLKKDTEYIINLQHNNYSQQYLLLKSNCLIFIKSNKLELNNVEKNIENMKPENVLRRGYSITLINNKSIKSTTQIKESDIINTILFDGSFISEVKSTQQKNQENE